MSSIAKHQTTATACIQLISRLKAIKKKTKKKYIELQLKLLILLIMNQKKKKYLKFRRTKKQLK